MSATTTSLARRLAQRECDHPVVSVYLDLDPDRFSIPPSRESQVHSLLDGARRAIEGDSTRCHEDRIALREDLDRIAGYLRAPDLNGARSLAIFCSVRDGLFEVIRVPAPAQSRVEIERRPYIEPLLAASTQRRWLIVVFNRRLARFFTGTGQRLIEQRRVTHAVHGQHEQGGWSQAVYQRSIDKEVMDSLRDVAELTERTWRRERFDRLAVGGPPELVPRILQLLRGDVRRALAGEHLELDVETATNEDVARAAAPIVLADEQAVERAMLDQLRAGIATGGNAAAGPEATLDALNQRRVHALLLTPEFERDGARCPECGMLGVGAGARCATDGADLEHVEHLREASVEAALDQDAEVVVVRHHGDLGPHQGIAALLRF